MSFIQMSIDSFLKEKDKINISLLEFVEDEDVNDLNYQNKIKHFVDHNFLNNQQDITLILYFLSKISKKHLHTKRFLFNVRCFFQFFKDSIKKYIENYDLFNLFQNDKRILLLLIEEKILFIDEQISLIMTTGQYIKDNYPLYFFPEINNFIQKTIAMKQNNDIWKQFQDFSKSLPENYDKKRKIGENDNYLCEIIRNDKIDEFITYVKQINLSLESKIESSIFETNSILLRKSPTILEYALFFESTKIIGYLLERKVKISSSLWIYSFYNKAYKVKHIKERNVIINNLSKKDLNNVSIEIDRLKEKITNIEQIAVKIDTFSERMLEIEETKNKLKCDNNDFSKIKKAISCLKYEIKRLKKQQQDKYDNDDIVESLHCLKYEVKQIKEAMNLNNLSKIKNDIGSLKYEVKRLKKYIAVENSVPFNVDERIINISEALRCIKYKMRQFRSAQLIQTEQIGEINQKMNDLQNEISKCNNSVKIPIIINAFPHQKECHSNEEMDNIKDEISRMNENPIFKSEKLNDDYLHSFKDKMDELEKTLQFIEKNFKINSDITHLKNEVKKLKENKSVNNIADSDSLNKTANDIEEAIKCIKHEVKKLSEQPASVPEQVDFSPIVNHLNLKVII